MDHYNITTYIYMYTYTCIYIYTYIIFILNVITIDRSIV